jgi:hypothetical protein
MAASFGSALMSLSVTGPIAFAGSTRTETHAPSSPSGWPSRTIAMVEEGAVAGLHRAQMQPRGIVAHAVPFGAAIADEIVPAVDVRLRFHQPVRHRGFPFAKLSLAIRLPVPRFVATVAPSVAALQHKACHVRPRP